MVLRRGNERMLTEVVFAVWPSLDGKPFRQRADKYSPPDSVAFRVNGAVQRGVQFWRKNFRNRP